MAHPFFDTPQGKEFVSTLKMMKEEGIQPWTYEFMYYLNGIIPMMGVESCIFRKKNGRIEILLDKRGPEDIDWPGQYHVPGSTCRNTDIVIGKTSDEMYRSVLYRIWSKELSLTESQMSKISLVKVDAVLWRHLRGGCMSVVFACTANGVKFPKGKFYPANELPQPFLGGQEIVVNTALKWVFDNKYVFC